MLVHHGRQQLALQRWYCRRVVRWCIGGKYLSLEGREALMSAMFVVVYLEPRHVQLCVGVQVP